MSEQTLTPWQAALRLHSAGRHVIPTGGGDNGKKPLLKRWKQYQKRQPTGAELYQWQRSLKLVAGILIPTSTLVSPGRARQEATLVTLDLI